MATSLHPYARSRSLRALGLVAWLMFVFSALAAASPAGMGYAQGHAMHAVTAAAGAPSHQGLAHHEHSQQGRDHAFPHECCDPHAGDLGQTGGQACGCIGMCANAVPPMPAPLIMASWVSGDYAEPLRLHAPSAPVSPPLRPPSA